MKVNKNFAIKLVAEEPVRHVETRVVSCDGGGGALGHPKVYINLVRTSTRETFKAIKNIMFLLLSVDLTDVCTVTNVHVPNTFRHFQYSKLEFNCGVLVFLYMLFYWLLFTNLLINLFYFYFMLCLQHIYKMVLAVGKKPHNSRYLSFDQKVFFMWNSSVDLILSV